MLLGEFGDDGLAGDDTLGDRLAGMADEGLDQHELELRILRPGVGQELVVGRLVGLQRNVSAMVVNADHHGQQVGLEREGVLGPALLEVEHGVAAHAAVGEVELTFREACAVAGRDDERVPMTEDVVRVGRAAAVPVGDGVTLKRTRSFGVKAGIGSTAASASAQRQARSIQNLFMELS